MHIYDAKIAKLIKKTNMFLYFFTITKNGFKQNALFCHPGNNYIIGNVIVLNYRTLKHWGNNEISLDTKISEFEKGVKICSVSFGGFEKYEAHWRGKKKERKKKNKQTNKDFGNCVGSSDNWLKLKLT